MPYKSLNELGASDYGKGGGRPQQPQQRPHNMRSRAEEFAQQRQHAMGPPMMSGGGSALPQQYSGVQQGGFQFAEPYSNTPNASNYTSLVGMPMDQALPQYGREQQLGAMAGMVGHMPGMAGRQFSQQAQHAVPHPQYDAAQGPDICQRVAQHVDACKSCQRLYKRNNTQASMIIFLVFVIILLCTRLMDKSG